MNSARTLLLPTRGEDPIVHRREHRSAAARTIAAALILAYAGAGTGPTVAAEPIATAEGEHPGVRVEVTELKRTGGGTVMLRFAMVNESDELLKLGSNRFGEASVTSDHRSVGGAHLVDDANKKKYLVVRDSEGNCVCSRDVEDIKSGSRRALWARFPAPPEGVDKISVVIPHFLPMDDVPIGR